MPIQVLIVDDEEHQRKGLIKHVKWSKFDMEIIGEAESADEALEVASLCPPDLMITDIFMHGKDGLFLSETMKQLYSELKIIIITGYEKFDYAKSAIDLGVDAMLLKPVDFEELSENLNAISHSYHNDLKKQEDDEMLRRQVKELIPMAREKFLNDILNGNAVDNTEIKKRSEYLDMFRKPGEYTVAVITAYNDEEIGTEQKDIINLGISKMAEKLLGSGLEAVTSSRSNIVLIIRNEEMGEDQVLRAKLETLCVYAQKEFVCKINVGIGPTVASVRKIDDSFKLALRAINERFFLGSGLIINWSDIGDQSVFLGTKTDHIIKELQEALRLGEKEEMNKLFHLVAERFIRDEAISDAEIRSVCFKLISDAIQIVVKLTESLGRRFDTEIQLFLDIIISEDTINIIKVTQETLQKYCDIVVGCKKSRFQAIVEQTTRFIGTNYMENVTLQMVAEHVYLSPSYLGAVIRSELNISFTDYLINVRIENAKELLKDQQLKLYHVSKLVGYQNPNYFAGIFKRVTGMTPIEYRNSVSNN